MFNHGRWQLAVGGWRVVAIGSRQLVAVGGGWRLVVFSLSMAVFQTILYLPSVMSLFKLRCARALQRLGERECAEHARTHVNTRQEGPSLALRGMAPPPVHAPRHGAL